jgi:glyoxylase-like metal-dependent hydrolase (beta-lactamase superfamily II)
MHRLAVLLTAALPAALQAQAADPLVMRIEPLQQGSYLISGYTNGNLLAVVGRQGVLLVDGQSARRVDLADSALRTATRLPVRIVVNTHYHEDHIAGNPHWRSRGATIIGHAALAAEARKDTTIPELEWHRSAAVPEALPDRTFDDSLALEVEDEPVILIHPGRAHTNGDAIVWLPRRNIVHTGDILEREAPPFIDWWAGGSLDGMLRGVDRVLAIADASTIIVPGHGTPTDRAGLLAYRTMLVAARERIGPPAKSGASPEAIADTRPLREFEAMLGGERKAKQFVVQVARGLGGRR